MQRRHSTWRIAPCNCGFLTEMKGFDEVFSLKTRYKQYAADRRKVVKEGSDPLASSSSHEGGAASKATADPLGAKTCHGSFFEYYGKQQQPKKNTNGRRKKTPLRAKSLDLEDTDALKRAMLSLQQGNDDESSSSSSFARDNSSSSSSDSSFTASLCSYGKEMRSHTDCMERRPYVRGGKRTNTAPEVLSMQIDVDAKRSQQQQQQADDDDSEDELLDIDAEVKHKSSHDVAHATKPSRKVPTHSKSLDLDATKRLKEVAAKLDVSSSSSSGKKKTSRDKSSSSKTDKCKDTDESSKSSQKISSKDKTGKSKDMNGSKCDRKKQSSSSKSSKKEDSKDKKTKKTSENSKPRANNE